MRVYYSDGGSGNTSAFVPLDLTRNHTYEWLLKGGQVTYRIDGSVTTPVRFRGQSRAIRCS